MLPASINVQIRPVRKTHPKLALGCWAFAGEHWGGQPESETFAAMEVAWEQGLRHWDTAIAYGKGYSERLGDLFDLDESFRERFDTVFEHTCFCAIDPSLREEYVRVIHSTLRKSGTLLAIFYIEIEDPEGPPFPVSDEELDGRRRPAPP